MRDLFNLRSPMMRPLWVRLLVTGLTLGWTVMELVNGNTGWALMFGAAGAWCAWEFFVVFDPANYQPPEETPGEDKPAPDKPSGED